MKQKAKHNDNEFVIEVAVQFFRVKITPAGESTEEIMSFCKGFNSQLLLSNAYLIMVYLVSFIVDYSLGKKKWSFIGVTVDGINNQTTLFANDAWGFVDTANASANGRVRKNKYCMYLKSNILFLSISFQQKYYTHVNYDWVSEVFQTPIKIGADDPASGILPYDGSISCLQFFDYALNPAEVRLKAHCPDLPEEYKSDPCPEGWEFLHVDGMCYKVSLNPGTHAQAEMMCLPDVESPYESQLMYTENPRVWEYVLKIQKAQNGDSSIWAGLSDRDGDGNYETSYGDMVANDAPIFNAAVDPCGFVSEGSNGHIDTSSCDYERHYVCSMKPLYAKPDYRCPKNFVPYRGRCLAPDRRTLSYEAAQVECSNIGSIILPIKDPDLHAFIMTWGGKAVGVDIWVGLRNQKWRQYYDEEQDHHPLAEVKTAEFTYSDDTPFKPEEPDFHYAIGLRKFKSECYVLKASDDYKTVGVGCNKEKGFICLWQEYECPEGYSYIGQLSDGKTCHGTTEAATFDEATCDHNDDMLRKGWTPKTPYEVDRFRRKYVKSDPK